MQNKYLRIILNKQRDTLAAFLHQMANIPTIEQFIWNSVQKAYDFSHLLIRGTGNYSIEDLPLEIRVTLPKHVNLT